MKRLATLYLGLTLLVSAWAQETPEGIRQRVAALRPDEGALSFYRLDWAPTLDAALDRAARERRPVMLVIIHARYGDLYSGHC